MLFLGVDSGGTKTAFVLCGERGKILARHTAGGGAYYSIGEEGIYRLVSEGARAVCAEAGCTTEDITYAGFGFPGYGEGDGSAEKITGACERALPHTRIKCECDSYLGWAGSFGMEPGINIIAGTGTICLGVNEKGEQARSSGWGAYCDEGSCRWLGSRLIALFTRQADGRMPKSLLYGFFRERLGIVNDLDFIGPLNDTYQSGASLTASLQRLLVELYDMGDENAAALYNEAARELSLAAETVARKLKISGGFNVSYSGGLFKSGERILTPLRKALEAAGGTLKAPRFTPESGAVLMAMRLASPEAVFHDMEFTQDIK